MDPAGASRSHRSRSRACTPIPAPRRAPGGDAELKREAETLRRLADQLESLAEERRATRQAVQEVLPACNRDVLARAAARLPGPEATALLELPYRLRNATRRVRLSAEILTHHLETMSMLLHKAALDHPSSRKVAV